MCTFGCMIELVSISGCVDASSKAPRSKLKIMLSSMPGTISKRMIGQSDSADETQLALQRQMRHLVPPRVYL